MEHQGQFWTQRKKYQSYKKVEKAQLQALQGSLSFLL